MIDKLGDHLRFNSEALRLRSTRQQMLASNVVNAETPRYQARDFDFARALRDATAAPVRASAAAARPQAGNAAPATYARAAFQSSPEGNMVDMDAERAYFADNALRYEAALRALNGQLKTLLSAIQG